MVEAIIQREIPKILDRVMQNISSHVIDIRLCDQPRPLTDDQICTIHTKFEGGYCGILVLYTDMELLLRLVRDLIPENEISPQDVEDFAKEYFNVICGQIVSQLFEATHIASRFHIPTFCRGKYVPEGLRGGGQCVRNYVSRYNEGAQLIHQFVRPMEKTKPHEEHVEKRR